MGKEKLCVCSLVCTCSGCKNVPWQAASPVSAKQTTHNYPRSNLSITSCATGSVAVATLLPGDTSGRRLGKHFRGTVGLMKSRVQLEVFCFVGRRGWNSFSSSQKDLASVFKCNWSFIGFWYDCDWKINRVLIIHTIYVSRYMFHMSDLCCSLRLISLKPFYFLRKLHVYLAPCLQPSALSLLKLTVHVCFTETFLASRSKRRLDVILSLILKCLQCPIWHLKGFLSRAVWFN